MSREDLMKRMSFLKTSVDDAKTEASEAEQAQLEEINKAIEQLKNEYDNLPEDPELAATEGTGDKQLDREVERPVGVAALTDVSSEQPMELNMDEYVEPIEEVKDGEEGNLAEE